MGQGQLRIIIYINFVELEYIMLHPKFHDHRTISSVGEDFKGFYHIWAWQPCWSCDLDHLFNVSFPLIPRRLHMKFVFAWPSGFRENNNGHIQDTRNSFTNSGPSEGIQR